MCVRISMLRSFTKSQCAWFSTAGGWEPLQVGRCGGPFPSGPQSLPELTFHDPPGVQATSNPLPLGLHHRVASNHSEGCTLLGRGRCIWPVSEAGWRGALGGQLLCSTSDISDLSTKRSHCLHCTCPPCSFFVAGASCPWLSRTVPLLLPVCPAPLLPFQSPACVLTVPEVQLSSDLT